MCVPRRQGRAKRTPGGVTFDPTYGPAPGPLSTSKTLLSLLHSHLLDPHAEAPSRGRRTDGPAATCADPENETPTEKSTSNLNGEKCFQPYCKSGSNRYLLFAKTLLQN